MGEGGNALACGVRGLLQVAHKPAVRRNGAQTHAFDGLRLGPSQFEALLTVRTKLVF